MPNRRLVRRVAQNDGEVKAELYESQMGSSSESGIIISDEHQLAVVDGGYAHQPMIEHIDAPALVAEEDSVPELDLGRTHLDERDETSALDKVADEIGDTKNETQIKPVMACLSMTP